MSNTPAEWWTRNDDKLFMPPTYWYKIRSAENELIDYEEERKKPVRDRKNISIASLDLDSRIKNILDDNKLYTIGDVVKNSYKKILGLKNCNMTTVIRLAEEFEKLDVLELWDYIPKN